MFNKLMNYIKETKIEMKGVKWPTRKQAVNYTLLVIGACIGRALFLGAFLTCSSLIYWAGLCCKIHDIKKSPSRRELKNVH